MQNPLYWRFPTVLCVLKKTNCISAHMWKVTEDNKDGAMTREQPLTSWYHHCVTFVLHPRISSEEREKKEIAFQTYEEHLSARVSLGSAERKEEGAKLKKRRERQKGAAAAAVATTAAAVPSCHSLDHFCWHILRQPARSPPATPALNTLPPPHPAPQ